MTGRTSTLRNKELDADSGDDVVFDPDPLVSADEVGEGDLEEESEDVVDTPATAVHVYRPSSALLSTSLMLSVPFG